MEKEMPPVSMSGESAIRVIDWITNRGISAEDAVECVRYALDKSIALEPPKKKED